MKKPLRTKGDIVKTKGTGVLKFKNYAVTVVLYLEYRIDWLTIVKYVFSSSNVLFGCWGRSKKHF